MRRHTPCFGTIIGGLVLAYALPAGTVYAQTGEDTPETSVARPKYAVIPPHGDSIIEPDATPLPTWNGSFIYKGTTYTYNMVGNDPSTDLSTSVPVYIIPIKLIITNKNNKIKTYDPATVLPNGLTVVQNTVASPIFDSQEYIQGSVDVGSTQYIDAYQRANFWSIVKKNSDYHLFISGPAVLDEQTLSPPAAYGTIGSPLGYRVGEVDINWFDLQLQTIIKATSQIKQNTLPIFLLYDTYLTNGGCCIGGYHSALGKINARRAYIVFSYLDIAGTFAQDVSTLSHEVGEWADDPLVVNDGNNTPCGILEVGDPLENNPNYGAYPYTLNGFTYNLQDLVFLRYFGAPANTSVNHYFTFQGEQMKVCQKGS
jgi:hypothetical protein